MVGVYVYVIKDLDKLNLVLILIKKNCVNICRYLNFEILYFKFKKNKKKDWNDSKKIFCVFINLILFVFGLLNSFDW